MSPSTSTPSRISLRPRSRTCHLRCRVMTRALAVWLTLTRRITAPDAISSVQAREWLKTQATSPKDGTNMGTVKARAIGSGRFPGSCLP